MSPAAMYSYVETATAAIATTAEKTKYLLESNLPEPAAAAAASFFYYVLAWRPSMAGNALLYSTIIICCYQVSA